MSEQYTYAVARIRALEVSLFSDSTIDQLIACQNYDQALQFLEEKGWGDAESSGDAEKILTREEEKTWEVVKELSIGMEHFDVLSYPKLFHNLKAAVKEVCTGDKNRHIYYEDVRIPGEEMRKIVEDRDFGKLPDSMRIAGEEAYPVSPDGMYWICSVEAAAPSWPQSNWEGRHSSWNWMRDSVM